MNIYNFSKKRAFTLIELLIVIAIIGILSTLVVVALGNSRTSARDAKRLNDLKSIASALELYYSDNNEYPPSITPGSPLQANDIIYMSKVPNNPTPRNEGDCADSDYRYLKTATGYSLITCLGTDRNELPAGGVVSSNNLSAIPFGPMNGLVAWWPFLEQSGSTVYDYSGSGNHGTINGTAPNIPAWSVNPDNSKSFLQFTGISGYVAMSSNISFTNSDNWTWMAWVSLEASAGNFQFITRSSNYGITFRSTDSSILRFREISTGTYYAFGDVPLNQWRHITYRVEGANMTVYLNGSVLSTQSIPNTSATMNHIFGGNVSSSYLFKGGGRDVRVYNRALSGEEIQKVYLATN